MPHKSDHMEHQLMYRYSKMDLSQFAIFDENCNQPMDEVQFNTEAQFSFDKDSSVLCSTIVVNASFSDKPIMKAELRSYFDIHPDSIEGMRNNGHILFLPHSLVQFASLCYGSMRGIIFSKTQGTVLSQYILPPVYFSQLIDKGFSVEY